MFLAPPFVALAQKALANEGAKLYELHNLIVALRHEKQAHPRPLGPRTDNENHSKPDKTLGYAACVGFGPSHVRKVISG